MVAPRRMGTTVRIDQGLKNNLSMRQRNSDINFDKNLTIPRGDTMKE